MTHTIWVLFLIVILNAGQPDMKVQTRSLPPHYMTEEECQEAGNKIFEEAKKPIEFWLSCEPIEHNLAI